MAILVLNDGKTYAVADYATENNFSILLDSLIADDVLETLTEENLSKIRFMTDNDKVIGVYHDKMLCGYTEHGDVLEVRINDANLCRYGLILDENSRIVSAVAQRYAPENAIIVDNLPEGNPHDYLYVDGEYVHDPLPITDDPDPQPTYEDRIAALEAQNETLLECLLEMSEIVYA